MHDPKSADSAIFYSINNAQRGLDGISFGNFLIKRVVDRLSKEFPNLKTFATLLRSRASSVVEDGPGTRRPGTPPIFGAQDVEQHRRSR